MRMPEEQLDLGEAVTDHGPHAGQLVRKVVVNPPVELVEAARKKVVDADD